MVRAAVGRAIPTEQLRCVLPLLLNLVVGALLYAPATLNATATGPLVDLARRRPWRQGDATRVDQRVQAADRPPVDARPRLVEVAFQLLTRAGGEGRDARKLGGRELDVAKDGLVCG
jgi:hypothetical protein